VTVDEGSRNLHRCKSSDVETFNERQQIKNMLLEWKMRGYVEYEDGTTQRWINATIDIYNQKLTNPHPWYDIFAEIEGWKTSAKQSRSKLAHSARISSDVEHEDCDRFSEATD